MKNCIHYQLPHGDIIVPRGESEHKADALIRRRHGRPYAIVCEEPKPDSAYFRPTRLLGFPAWRASIYAINRLPD